MRRNIIASISELHQQHSTCQDCLFVSTLTEELLVQFSWNSVEGWRVDHEGIRSVLECIENHMADTLIIFRMSGIWLQVCPSSPTREGSGGRASQTGSVTYLVRCILCNRETYIYLKDLMGFHGLLQSGHIPLSIFPWSYISSHCLGWSVSSRDHDKVPPDALQSVLVLRSAVSFTQHHLCVLRPQQGVVWWQGRLWLQLLHEKVLKY